MSFLTSFDDVSDIFGTDYSAQTSFDPFSSESDTNRTGLENDLDRMEDHDPSQPDSDFDAQYEDLDEEEQIIDVGESIDEEMLNEVDLDFDDITEPDFNPEDDEPVMQNPTDISHEDGDEVEIDDNTGDQWEEVSDQDEIRQEDDIIQDDNISQMEEAGQQEPLYYPDDDDTDPDPTNNAVSDILEEHISEDDLTDDIIDEINRAGEFITAAGDWVQGLEDFLDFTESDTSTFHETDDGFLEGITDGDYYDPPNPTFMADGIIELSNLVDDVFSDVFPDPVNDAFSWFDSFV